MSYFSWLLLPLSCIMNAGKDNDLKLCERKYRVISKSDADFYGFILYLSWGLTTQRLMSYTSWFLLPWICIPNAGMDNKLRYTINSKFKLARAVTLAFFFILLPSRIDAWLRKCRKDLFISIESASEPEPLSQLKWFGKHRTISLKHGSWENYFQKVKQKKMIVLLSSVLR